MKALYARLLAWLLAPVVEPLRDQLGVLASSAALAQTEAASMRMRLDAVTRQANENSKALDAQSGQRQEQ